MASTTTVYIADASSSSPSKCPPDKINLSRSSTIITTHHYSHHKSSGAPSVTQKRADDGSNFDAYRPHLRSSLTLSANSAPDADILMPFPFNKESKNMK